MVVLGTSGGVVDQQPFSVSIYPSIYRFHIDEKRSKTNLENSSIRSFS